jgi:pSer/pThr/pTyr-binding forkhead associated (FHA) protein
VTVIGRAAEADVRLDDPGISRRHAEVRFESGAFVLVDLGSTNGVRVNDVATTRRQLSPGDRVELGSTTLVFRHDED